MTRIPLATDLKTRTGAPSTKDARQVNSYMEVKGDQAAVRKRPAAQGGLAIGTGTAQGGIGLTIGGTPYFIGFWGDTLYSYSGSGTTWSSGASYVIGDHVTVNFVDYWALANNTNSQPPSINWDRDYVPPLPTGSWTAGTMAITPYVGNHPIAWNGSTYVYLANNPISGLACPFTSSDGLNWTQQADIPGFSYGVTGLYSINWNGSQFLVVGGAGVGVGYWATSANGITWTVYNDGGVTPDFYDVAWNGTNYCAVAGTITTAYTSTNGITWTAHGIPAGDYQSITWNGTVFCAVSRLSTLAITSTNGVAWSSQTLPSSTSWTRIVSLAGVMCAACQNGTATAVSTNNGTTWTGSTLSGILSANGLGAGNGLFIAVSANSSTANYCTSTDGITWTSRTLPVAKLWFTAFHGAKFLVMDNTTVCATSTTGL